MSLVTQITLTVSCLCSSLRWTHEHTVYPPQLKNWAQAVYQNMTVHDMEQNHLSSLLGLCATQISLVWSACISGSHGDLLLSLPPIYSNAAARLEGSLLGA